MRLIEDWQRKCLTLRMSLRKKSSLHTLNKISMLRMSMRSLLTNPRFHNNLIQGMLTHTKGRMSFQMRINISHTCQKHGIQYKSSTKIQDQERSRIRILLWAKITLLSCSRRMKLPLKKCLLAQAEMISIKLSIMRSKWTPSLDLRLMREPSFIKPSHKIFHLSMNPSNQSDRTHSRIYPTTLLIQCQLEIHLLNITISQDSMRLSRGGADLHTNSNSMPHLNLVMNIYQMISHLHPWMIHSSKPSNQLSSKLPLLNLQRQKKMLLWLGSMSPSCWRWMRSCKNY